MFANWNLFPNFNTSQESCDLVVNLQGFGVNLKVRDNDRFSPVPPVRTLSLFTTNFK